MSGKRSGLLHILIFFQMIIILIAMIPQTDAKNNETIISQENEPTPIICCMNEQPIVISVRFNNISDDREFEYFFDWGDGTTWGWTSIKVATHQYNISGHYTVNVSIRDSENALNYKEVDVQINRDDVDTPPPNFGLEVLIILGIFFLLIIIVIIIFLIFLKTIIHK